MGKITAPATRFTFIFLLCLASPLVEEVLPLLQVTAYTAVAVNNGIQIAKHFTNANPD